MSISLRFSLLFGMAILVMGSLAGLATAAREYGVQLDMASSRTESRLLGHPGLQYFIYQSNGEQLQAELTEFLRDDSSIMAQAYNGLGDKLAQVEAAGANGLKPAMFSLVRGSLLAGDTGLISFASDTGAPMGNGFWSALFDQRAPIYQSLPVFTQANTGRSGLTATDFALALTSSDDIASQRIVGYLHILHSRSALLDTALMAGLRVFSINLVLALICGILAWFFTRRITQPFRELADMADSVSSGQVTEPIAVKGSGELQDIARVFNSVIEGFNDSKKIHEVDKRLLSLKVEERSSQLSERDQALSKASSEAEEARSRLQQMANYDNLTALPNRHLLTEQLDLLLKLNPCMLWDVCSFNTTKR